MTLEQVIEKLENSGIHEIVLAPNQILGWLKELRDTRELEEKHWNECMQIAKYDDEVKLLCLIIQDRISYVTDYGKAILEGIYSDSYEYNKGYCTALNDILDLIYEVTKTEALKLLGGENDNDN